MTGAGQGAYPTFCSYCCAPGEERVDAAAYEALLLEVEGLKAALDKYGRHFGWCASISSRNTAEGCSCGFDAALSPASGGV